VCIVGIGESEYAKRGTFEGIGEIALAARAIRAACADAGISVNEIEGFTSFCDDRSTPTSLAPELGIPSWKYAMTVWGGGGSGLPTAMTSAVMAVATGVANYVVVLRSILQGQTRMGRAMGSASLREDGIGPPASYSVPFGFLPPMALYAMRARRHMALYGTTVDHLATVVVTQRNYAVNNPLAVFRTPLTVDDHHNARMIVDPFRLFDCCMESDGASAVIVTTPERAKDLKQLPVYVRGVSATTAHRWNSPVTYTEPDELIASSGHDAAARDLWSSAGAGPDDVDVAGFYDGSSVSPILAVEDWGFCARGEGGPFIAEGNMLLTGELPMNTSGGNLSEAYQQGINHLIECVRQLRGTSHNQVPNAEVALYASGQGYAPMGGILIRR
jgi:acetyl-CoA acetyltransferase